MTGDVQVCDFYWYQASRDLSIDWVASGRNRTAPGVVFCFCFLYFWNNWVAGGSCLHTLSPGWARMAMMALLVPLPSSYKSKLLCPEVKTDPPGFRGSRVIGGGAHFFWGQAWNHPAKSLGPDRQGRLLGQCPSLPRYKARAVYRRGAPAPPASHRGSCSAVLETGVKRQKGVWCFLLKLRAQNPGSAQGCWRRRLPTFLRRISSMSAEDTLQV